MSISKESQEYHLTPKGWLEGTFTGDVLGGKREVLIPKDRVLTIVCYDELPYAFSPPAYHFEVIWESEDKRAIVDLKAKWGDKPNWYGFKTK